MRPTILRSGRAFGGWRWFVLTVVLAASVLAVYFWQFTIVVTVANVGMSRMMNVKVEDWDSSVYEIGEIEPGEAASVITFPSGDVGATLVWRTDCILQSSPIMGYRALGMNGAIEVKVRGRDMVTIKSDG